MDGQSCKGVWADCVGFVGGVIDELYRIKTVQARPRVHKKKPHFDGNAHLELIKYLRTHWPSEVCEPTAVEPGDVLVCRLGQGPGHILLVGTRPNTAWHCVEGLGVCLAAFGSLDVLQSYRLLEKERWTSSII